VTALITGVHIPETSFSQLLTELRKRRRTAPASWNIARRIVHVFIFFAERGIVKEHRDFYILILIP
jgi:hypothetical protein